MSGPEAALILTRRDVQALMGPADWLEAVESGFAAAAEGKASSPPPMAIDGAGGMFHAKGAAALLDRHYVALKLNGNFPGNPDQFGLPTIQGAILLCDGATGSLIAIIDSIEVTLRRTAAATALAARFLARPDAATLLICGCGEQARAQLDALGSILPLQRIFAWDCDADRARHFAEARSGSGLATEIVSELAPAALASDIIITCTTARDPYLMASFVSPGTFIAAVGADSPEKSEIDPHLMAAACVVADVLDQCVVMGDLGHALEAGTMQRSDVHAELAGLVAGTRPGRTSANQITLFDSTGTALQDVASAAMIYRRALAAGHARTVALGQ